MFIRLQDDGNPYHEVLTTELLSSYIDDYNKIGDGEKLMGELILVGRADNRAQNPEMTDESLKLIDVMSEKLQDLINDEKSYT